MNIEELKSGYYWVQMTMLKTIGWRYVANDHSLAEGKTGEVILEVCYFEHDKYNPECSGWYRAASDEFYCLTAYGKSMVPLHSDPLAYHPGGPAHLVAKIEVDTSELRADLAELLAKDRCNNGNMVLDDGAERMSSAIAETLDKLESIHHGQWCEELTEIQTILEKSINKE